MSTKDEIRAALLQGLIDEYGFDEAHWNELRSLDNIARRLAALLPAETETVEWGVRHPDGSEEHAGDREALCRQTVADTWTDSKVIRSTVTTYATTRTPWEEA